MSNDNTSDHLQEYELSEKESEELERGLEPEENTSNLTFKSRGDLTPSREDTRITRQLQDAGETLGISILTISSSTGKNRTVFRKRTSCMCKQGPPSIIKYNNQKQNCLLI